MRKLAYLLAAAALTAATTSAHAQYVYTDVGMAAPAVASSWWDAPGYGWTTPYASAGWWGPSYAYSTWWGGPAYSSNYAYAPAATYAPAPTYAYVPGNTYAYEPAETYQAYAAAPACHTTVIRRMTPSGKTVTHRTRVC